MVKKILLVLVSLVVLGLLVRYLHVVSRAQKVTNLSIAILWSKQYPVILFALPRREFVLIDAGVEQVFTANLAKYLFFFEKELSLFIASGEQSAATKGLNWLESKYHIKKIVSPQETWVTDNGSQYVRLNGGFVVLFPLLNQRRLCADRCLAILLCSSAQQSCFLFAEKKQIGLQRELAQKVKEVLASHKVSLEAVYLGKIRKGERVDHALIDIAPNARWFITPTGKYQEEVWSEVLALAKEKPLSITRIEEGKEVFLEI